MKSGLRSPNTSAAILFYTLLDNSPLYFIYLFILKNREVLLFLKLFIYLAVSGLRSSIQDL